MERSHELEEMDRKPFEALMLDYDHKAEVGEYVHNRLTAQQIEHIRQLLRLIDGYESAYALEVLASVAYVRSQEPGISLDDSIRRIESWSQRKKDLFKREHIQAAYLVDNLSNSNPVALKRVAEILGVDEIPFHKVDIRDREGLEKVFAEHMFDACIHFAGLKAVVKVWRSRGSITKTTSRARSRWLM